MPARTHHPAIKSVTFTPTGKTAEALDEIRARRIAENDARMAHRAAHPDAKADHRDRLAREGRDI